MEAVRGWVWIFSGIAQCMHVYVYAYVIFVMGFFLLCALGTPSANYSGAFPEKVWQCRNAAVC